MPDSQPTLGASYGLQVAHKCGNVPGPCGDEVLWEWSGFQQLHILSGIRSSNGCHFVFTCSTSGLWGAPREVPEGESDLWAVAERLPLRQVDTVHHYCVNN